MQYQVPQFIDIEDKIIGPLTLKQFLYLASGFLLSFFAFFTLQFFIWIVFTLFILIISLALAFFRYNGRPLLILIKSLFNYFWQPRLYIWNKNNKTAANIPVAGGNLESLNLKLNNSSQPIKGEKSFKLPFLHALRKTKKKYEVFRKITGEREVARKIDYR